MSHDGILKPGFFCGGGGASAAALPKKAIGIRETWRVSPVTSTGLAKTPVFEGRVVPGARKVTPCQAKEHITARAMRSTGEEERRGAIASGSTVCEQAVLRN